MKIVEMTGKTVSEALKRALDQLNLTEDKVKVEVVQEPSKGFLNIIGNKPAKIRVIQKPNYIEDGRVFLRDVLDAMGIEGEIDFKEEKDVLHINITGPKMGLIIGYRGETLDSLQYLISLVVNKNHDIPYKKIVLDTENYRAKREETLKRVAQKTAYKVRKSGRAFKLEPMNPYERRVIHSVLQDNEFINTYSEGDEPYRRIVVDIKK
ncbi:MAG: RNA-binding cell elongation regulator Jag/EloR [Clostridium sp.]